MVYVAHMSNVAQAPSGLLSTAEVARSLGVTVTTVNRWAGQGRIVEVAKGPGLRGARLFDAADVAQIAQQLAGDSGPAPQRSHRDGRLAVAPHGRSGRTSPKRPQ